MKHDHWRDYAEDTAAIRYWKRECLRREAMMRISLLSGFILGGVVGATIAAWVI